MKNLLAVLFLLCVTASAFAAVVPGREPEFMQVQQRGVNPDPFNVQAAPPAPTPAPAPVVNVTVPPPPEQSTSWISILWAVLGTIATAILAKLGFKLPPPSTSVVAGDHGTIETIIKAVLHPEGAGAVVGDPNLRAMIDAALLRVVQSGIPGGVIQTGAGMIPGVGGLIGTLEPLLRRIVISTLNERLAANQGGVNPSPMTAPAVPPDFALGIEAIVKNAIHAALEKRA